MFDYGPKGMGVRPRLRPPNLKTPQPYTEESWPRLMQHLIVYSVDASSRDARDRKDTLLVLLLMIDIPHYLEDPKL